MPQPLKPFNFSSVLTKFKTPAVKCCGLHYNAIRAEQVSCLVQVISTENKQKSTSSYSSNIMAGFQDKEPLQKGRRQQGCDSYALFGICPVIITSSYILVDSTEGDY